MIQLDKIANYKMEPALKDNDESTFRGLLIAICIIGLWTASLVLLLGVDLKNNINIFVLLLAVIWQTFLYTGLFITAHDAMHGVIFPKNIKINHFVGTICLLLYGFFPYRNFLKKHWLHHNHPASELDPDFHNSKYKNLFAWYFHFIRGYWSWGQILGVTMTYNILHYFGHIPKENLNLFWAIPPILSSLQLFYFGTFLPHREPVEGYTHPHRAKTTPFPIWLSFISCYHFGYHEEHHQYPHLPWWSLPKVYMNKRAESSLG